jgi:catechol 2,3-dioxygenase-like lactoylglutathione lyase family enzyme
MTEWFARPVLHVSSVEAALLFYVDRLGFRSPGDEEDGRARVAQVDRQSCALILSEQWREKVDALRARLEGRGVPVKDGHWGYRLLVVEDLDGNQLFFNYPTSLRAGSKVWSSWKRRNENAKGQVGLVGIWCGRGDSAE